MNFNTVTFKGLCLGAALLFVAACETAPEDAGAGTGEGASRATTSTTQSAARTGVEAAAPAPGSQMELETLGNQAYFDLNRYDLRADARATVEKWAEWLQRYPAVTVSVQGHADERGTREYNLGLGERRANSIRDYLIALGVNPERIATISYGKERPVCVEHNEDCWWRNRRGVMMVN